MAIINLEQNRFTWFSLVTDHVCRQQPTLHDHCIENTHIHVSTALCTLISQHRYSVLQYTVPSWFNMSTNHAAVPILRYCSVVGYS